MPRLVPCPSCKRHVFVKEHACPHCGSKGTPFLAAIAVAATVGIAGCSDTNHGSVPVYGPAPAEPTTRESPAATASETAAATTTADEPPPRVDVDVYGPPPVEPELRSSTATAQPTGPQVAPKPPPVTVYGPPPMEPSQRIDPKPKK